MMFSVLVNRFSNVAKSSDKNNNAPKKLLSRGYTLVELVLVVAILALFVTTAIVGFSAIYARRATKMAKLVDTEISLFASNSVNRDGEWRMVFRPDDTLGMYVLTQEYNLTGESYDWVIERTLKIEDVEISFDDEDYTDFQQSRIYTIGVSRETGAFRTDGGFYSGTIYFRSSAKTVKIIMSANSGGHRVE